MITWVKSLIPRKTSVSEFLKDKSLEDQVKYASIFHTLQKAKHPIQTQLPGIKQKTQLPYEEVYEKVIQLLKDNVIKRVEVSKNIQYTPTIHTNENDYFGNRTSKTFLANIPATRIMHWLNNTETNIQEIAYRNSQEKIKEVEYLWENPITMLAEIVRSDQNNDLWRLEMINPQYTNTDIETKIQRFQTYANLQDQVKLEQLNHKFFSR